MNDLSYGPFISRKQAQEQGLRYYFTGKPCKHGHVAVRYSSVGKCFTCRYESTKRFAAERTGEALETYKAKQRAIAAAWRSKNPQLNRKRIKACEEANKESYSKRVAAYQKEKRRTDKTYRVMSNLRKRVRLALKAQQAGKAWALSKIVGCTSQELATHLEKQFAPGMTWENWSINGWHVDHIRPCASFDLTDPEQQRQCFHYSNLQPLWAEDNLRKSDTWEPVAA